MFGKFSLGDIIIYKGIIYKVNSVHSLNWFVEHEPIVYGLINVESNEVSEYSGKELMIREGLLNYITQHQMNVWKVLYGES